MSNTIISLPDFCKIHRLSRYVGKALVDGLTPALTQKVGMGQMTFFERSALDAALVEYRKGEADRKAQRLEQSRVALQRAREVWSASRKAKPETKPTPVPAAAAAALDLQPMMDRLDATWTTINTLLPGILEKLEQLQDAIDKLQARPAPADSVPQEAPAPAGQSRPADSVQEAAAPAGRRRPTVNLIGFAPLVNGLIQSKFRNDYRFRSFPLGSRLQLNQSFPKADFTLVEASQGAQVVRIASKTCPEVKLVHNGTDGTKEEAIEKALIEFYVNYSGE